MYYKYNTRNVQTRNLNTNIFHSMNTSYLNIILDLQNIANQLLIIDINKTKTFLFKWSWRHLWILFIKLIELNTLQKKKTIFFTIMNMYLFYFPFFPVIKQNRVKKCTVVGKKNTFSFTCILKLENHINPKTSEYRKLQFKHAMGVYKMYTRLFHMNTNILMFQILNEAKKLIFLL